MLASTLKSLGPSGFRAELLSTTEQGRTSLNRLLRFQTVLNYSNQKTGNALKYFEQCLLTHSLVDAPYRLVEGASFERTSCGIEDQCDRQVTEMLRDRLNGNRRALLNTPQDCTCNSNSGFID